MVAHTRNSCTWEVEVGTWGVEGQSGLQKTLFQKKNNTTECRLKCWGAEGVAHLIVYFAHRNPWAVLSTAETEHGGPSSKQLLEVEVEGSEVQV